MSDDAPSVEDALQVAQRALAKVTDQEARIGDLEERCDELREDLTAATLRLQEHDEETAYPNLTRDDKVGMVREHAFRRACDSGGHAKIDYDDVRWEVFEGEPSPDHCYTLLKLAAEETPGFEYQDHERGNYHLRVDAAAAKRSVAFSSAKKAPSGGGR